MERALTFGDVALEKARGGWTDVPGVSWEVERRGKGPGGAVGVAKSRWGGLASLLASSFARDMAPTRLRVLGTWRKSRGTSRVACDAAPTDEMESNATWVANDVAGLLGP